MWSSVVTLSLTCTSRHIIDSLLTPPGRWSHRIDTKTKQNKRANLIKVEEAVNKKISRQKTTEETCKRRSISSPDCWKTGSSSPNRQKWAELRPSLLVLLSTWFHIMTELRLLRGDFLLALHWAEEGALHGHEALAHQTLGATGALEALWLGVPVVLAVGDPLGFRLHRLLARRTFLERDGTPL